ncbi:MAG: tetratricopeptide repeat protein [Congregibacter sp.]
MESYRTEDEQVEALKGWWKENGQSTLIGVALALGLGFGWQGWQQHQTQQAAEASLTYQRMLEALSQEETVGADPGRELAEQLKEEHRGTTYAQFAALHLARLAVNAGNPGQAEQELRWVLSMADNGSEIHQIAQLRLARVLAAKGDSDGALAILQGASSGFVTSYAMARGDILLSLGREDEALIAYESAAASLDPGVPAPRSLQEKLQYLGARVATQAIPAADAEAG